MAQVIYGHSETERWDEFFKCFDRLEGKDWTRSVHGFMISSKSGVASRFLINTNNT